MAVVHLTHEVHLPGVTCEQAWDWVADTDSLNRAAGRPELDVKVMDARYGNSLALVSERRGLLKITWEERPFEFVRPRRYRVDRKVVKGPLVRLVAAAELAEDRGGTTVRFELEFHPRPSILAPIIGWTARFIGRRHIAQLDALLTRLAAEHRTTRGRGVWLLPPTPLGATAEQLLARRIQAVRRAAPRLVERLEAHLRSAPDHELSRIRPFELADTWGEPRMEVLRLLLHAAHAEILNLSWDTLCPHCRVPTFRKSGLDSLSAEATCEACDLTVATDFDEAVEVTFAIHPSIREVESVRFCLGSPAKRRGVLFQQVLAPGESRNVRVALPAGDYVLVRADSDRRLPVQVGDGGALVSATIGRDGVTTGESRKASTAPGEVEFRLQSALDGPVRVALALATANPDTASASIVTTLQDFRDLFSSQVLSPGVQLSRASVTLLFTDLKGSTSLYQQHGDNEMYARVRDHFEVLTDAVRAESGCVVKTIGDAVMASFTTPGAGFRAAIVMQRAIAKMNAERGTPELTVKVGLHCGPCLVVNANDRLDYFGNTVNQAARIEGQSSGGDVVMTDAMARDPEVAALLPQDGLVTSKFETQLKGLSGSFVLTRVEIAPDAARSRAASG